MKYTIVTLKYGQYLALMFIKKSPNHSTIENTNQETDNGEESERIGERRGECAQYNAGDGDQVCLSSNKLI